MFKKTYSTFIFLSCILCLSACEQLKNYTAKDIFSGNWENKEKSQKIQNQQLQQVANIQRNSSQAVVMCRSHQCAPTNLFMSKEYIYNSLLQLFDNNNYQTTLMCEADPNTHTCLENYITLPIRVGIVPTHAYIDHMKISDVIIGNKADKINLILTYNLTYGGQTAECTPSKSILFAKSVNHVLLEDAGYNCKMTTIGVTNVKTIFAIDFIDLDYGFIGGNYSVGFSGPAYGGGNGYMLMRLPKNAYPLSPSLRKPHGYSKVNNSVPGTNSANNTASSSARVEIFPIKK